jgi:AbiU2
MASNEQLLEKLRGWIERIRGEIIKLFFLNHIFWEIQDVIHNNPRLEESRNYFYEWMGEAFVYSAAMFVRRQVDIRRDSLSFLKLLRELSRNPSLINRENFLDRTTLRRTVLADITAGQAIEAERIFDELVGSGKRHLERALIHQDIEQLVEKSRCFEEFANHYVAHHSLEEMPSDKPTFRDLDSYINFIVSLLEKYYLLITGNRMPALDKDESFVPDWKEIFTFAWIELNEKEG